MALTPEEKSRKEALDKEMVAKGARMDPELRKELSQLNSKAQGTLSEGLSDLVGGLSGGFESTKSWLNKTSKEMEYKPEAPVPPKSTLDGMFGAASSLSPVPPTAQKEIEKGKPSAPPALTLEQEAADRKAKEDAAKKGKAIDLPEAMDGLIRQMNSLPADVQGKFKPQMDGINTTIANLNDGYQRDQEAAKGETEKKKNRAEWASIASLLAKNIVGYAAALNGVNPNAMSYQTTDWEKHIQGLNDELNMNLGNLRDSMKVKVEAHLGQKKDLQSNMDDTFKGRMEALRTKAGMLSDQARFEQQSKLASEEAAAKVAKEEKDRNSSTVKLDPPGKELDVAMGAASDKKTFEKGIGSLKSLAARYSINPAEIDVILKKYDTGFLGMGKGNEMTPEAQNEISQLFENKYRQLVTTKTTTGANAPSGQSPAPVVQSGSVPMFKDGKQYNIPADKVEAAKAKGYTLQ